MDKESTAIIEELKDFRKKINSKYKIKKIILFGSTERGEAKKDSDLDLILVSEEFQGKSSLKRPVPFHLEWNLDYPVDFLCFTPEEFKEKKKEIGIVAEAVKEGIEIT